MKKMISIIIVLGLLICTCGCEEVIDNIDSDLASEIQNLVSEETNNVTNPDEENPSEDEKVTSKIENNKSAEKSSNTVKEKSNKETISKDEPEITESNLPEVKFSVRYSNHRFTDMVNISNGEFAVSGHLVREEERVSVIQIYDENSNLKNEYSYGGGNGFDKIAVCSDGGFIAASYFPPCITKVNSNFETEWFMPYENVETSGTVQDIEEISPDLFAVLFVSVDSTDFSRRFKISYLNKAGELIETVDLMKNVDPQDADIISDGQGGFYLLSACNESLANKFPLVAENYDNSKATEAIIMHFSSNRELTWVKTLGGGGNDWIEESAIDNNGDIYLAVGTDWYGADSFWDMSVQRSLPYRRMLVKLDKNSNIVYKVPLSSKGMAVDQVFGIHIKDNNAYVVGMADYFDGYQVKYPCEQISPYEKGNRVFCVYNACIDSNGKELDRKIFRCDQNNMPCDSSLLPNGSLVIAGSVSAVENPFNLGFPLGVDSVAVLFIYK